MNAAITGNEIALFLLVLTRVSGFVLSGPLVGDPEVPRMIKVGVALALAVVLVQRPVFIGAQAPTALLPFVLAVVAQLLVGVALGFVARTAFFAMQTAGQIVGMQLGLSNAAVFNPLTRQPDPVTVQLYTVVAGLTFLAVRGDMWMVASLARSFDLAPLSGAAFSPALLRDAVSAAVAVTGLGLQIALPVAASLFGANVVLGVVSRAVPQLNVFMLSMPLDLLLGLLTIIGALAGTMLLLQHLFSAVPNLMLAPLFGGH